MSFPSITGIDMTGACHDCCDGGPPCEVGTSDLCGGDLETVIGGTCTNGTFTLTYSLGVGYINVLGGITALLGSSGGTYCATLQIIDLGQATYSYTGTDNPCTTTVTMNFVSSDGLCEGGGGAWPATITLGPP